MSAEGELIDAVLARSAELEREGDARAEANYKAGYEDGHADGQPWEWLRECLTCGKAHEYLNTNLPGRAATGSWADLADGHVYRPRVNPAFVDHWQSRWDLR